MRLVINVFNDDNGKYIIRLVQYYKVSLPRVCNCKMEPDSTTHTDFQFGHSFNSAETLSTPDDALHVCHICKAKATEVNVSEKRLKAEANQKCIFFVESKIFLLCLTCFEFCHLDVTM